MGFQKSKFVFAGAIALMAVTGLISPGLVSLAVADGALAVGSTGNVSKDGIAIGTTINDETAEKASASALHACKTYEIAKRAAAQCRVVGTFKEQCYSLAYDPKPGTPGAGWAIADTLVSAIERALGNCEATAGSSRRGYCAVAEARCDGFEDPKDADRAIANDTEAIKLYANNTWAFRNRGNAYVNKGEFDRAIQDYDQAIKLDQNDAIAFNNRGDAYKAKGNLDRAIADYSDAIRLNPANATYFRDRGRAYEDKKDYDRAIQDYDQAIRLNPNPAYAWNLPGIGPERLRG